MPKNRHAKRAPRRAPRLCPDSRIALARLVNAAGEASRAGDIDAYAQAYLTIAKLADGALRKRELRAIVADTRQALPRLLERPCPAPPQPKPERERPRLRLILGGKP